MQFCIQLYIEIILYLQANPYGYLFFSALDPRPSAPYVGPRPLGPSAAGPITFISADFHFLPVCVIKCSCATLIKHISEFSIHKY